MSRQDNLTSIEQERLNAEAAAQQEKNAIDQITQIPYTVISEEVNTINFPFGLSGSLTQLTDGTSYLVAGENIEILSSSNGQITISSTGGGAEPGGSDTHVQFNDGGTALGGSSSFTFNKTTNTLSVTNISGSLTKLTSGEDYIVPGANVTVSRMPNGSTQIGLDEEHDTWVRSTFTIVDEKDRGDLDSISATTAARNAVLAVQGGSVLSIVSDGAGGCFIGGSFTEVQGRTRAGIAHIDNFGQVTDWNPRLNGTVNSLVLSGSTLFAAGRFQRAGVTSSRAIELDATTEEMKDLRCNGDINVAVELPDGSTIVAGTFTRVLGKNRNRLAKINPDGTLNSWNPGADGAVNTAAISGTTLYVGGSFTGLGGGTGTTQKLRLGAIDVNTGEILPLSINANSTVNSLVLSGTTLYVGGKFTQMGGVNYSCLCSIDTQTMSLTAWNPNVGGFFAFVNEVYTLILSGTILYVGGYFLSVGSQNRNYAAALDVSTTTTSVTPWNPDFNYWVNSLAISGTTIYAGGEFSTVGSTNTRRGLAAVSSLGVGSVTSWDPNLSNASISSVIIRDSNVYVMGSFGSNSSRTIYLSSFAKIDLTSGNILSTKGGGSVSGKFAYANNIFYIGSAFTKQSNNFVALDTNYRQDLTSSIIDDSFITPFIGTFNDDSVSVSCLALSGTTLYAGGSFTSINGLSHNRLCAIDTQTMSLVGWNPGANGTVNSLQVSGSNLYVGGAFTGLGGGTGTTTRTRLGAINSSTGVVDPSWNPRAESTVNSIAISGSIAYVGGSFTSLTGSSGVASVRNRLGAINTSTGEVTSWNPGVSSTVRSLAISGSNVYAAGISSSRLFPIRGGLVAKRDSKGFFDVTSLNLNGTVEASVTLPDGSFIIGGSFTSVLGETRFRLAKINPDGTLSSWNPGANGTVNALALDVDPSGAPASQNPGFLYVGGSFSGLGSGTGATTRSRIGRIDTSTGTVLPWYPTLGATHTTAASATVRALHVFGSHLYVGGLFTTIGGLTRNNLVRIDRTTAVVDSSWCTLGAGSTVNALASKSDKIYVGGDFLTLAGSHRLNFGVLNANSGDLYGDYNPTLGLSWNPGKSTTTSVNDIKVSGSHVFVGGNFTSITNNTGTSAILSLRNDRNITPHFTLGTSNFMGDFGVLKSLVLSDGSIIVVGSFTRILGQNRTNIAKINSDGTLSSWAPTVSGKIFAMAVSGTTLYIGGDFVLVNSTTRNRLAALDTNTGALTTWNPGADSQVEAIAISGTVIYVGGYFTRIGAGQETPGEGSARSYIGAINTSGAVTTFNPGANSVVLALAVVGTTVYAGGTFTMIGGGGSGTSQRNYLAALTTAGAVSGWNPNPNGYVRFFKISGTTLYVAGDFTLMNGAGKNYIAAIDTATGLNTGFNAAANGYVKDLAFSGSNVFVASQFTTIGTDTRLGLTVVDSATGAPTLFDFNYSFNSTSPSVQTIQTLANDRLFIGGTFASVRDATSILEPDIENLIVLDAENGRLDPRHIQVSGSVSEINISGSNVYLVGNVSRSYNRARRGAMFNTADIRAGDLVLSGQVSANGTIWSSAPLPDGGFVFSGDFSRVGGKRRNRLARVNRDGSLHSWAPGMSPTYANAMVLSGSTLFLGGAFTHLTGSSGEVFSRAGLGAIDVDTGAVTPWVRTIGSSGYANALALSGSSLYVGGRFTTVGFSRRNIAEVSTTGVGTTTDWDPGANGDVYAIVVSGSVVYVGGTFTRLGGGGTGVATKLRIGAIDRSTGLATNWGPSANGDVSNLQISGSTVYVGGGFSLLTGSSGAILSRDKMGAIDKDTGEITSWVPKVNANFVYRMAISGSNLYVGRSNGLEAYELIAGEYRLFDQLNTIYSTQVRALAVTGSTLFVGGNFDVINEFSTNQGFLCVDSRTGIRSDENSSLISFVGAGTNNFSSVAFAGEAGSQTVLLAGTQTISSASVSGDAIHKLTVDPAGLNDLRPWTDARNKRSARQALSDISVIATGSIFMSDGIAIGGGSTSYETSSSLSYGGISTRNVSYIAGDDGTLDIIYDYYHGTDGASGEAGVGKYFFTLPAGFVIDRSVVQVGSVFSGNYHPNMSVGTATVQCDSAGGGGTWSVVPVDSKRFVLVGKDPTSDQVSVWGADSFPLSLPEIKVSVRAKIPVVETYF